MSTLRSKLLIAFVLATLVVPIGAGVALASPGDLDPTFGTGGIATPSMPGGSGVPGRIALQADGKIVAGGNCVGTVFDFCLARLNPDGSMDTTFDGDGAVQTDIANDFDEVYGVVVQPDGKIVAGGACGPNQYQYFCLARYNANGSLDSTFDGDGKLQTDVANNSNVFPGSAGGSKGRALLLQPDGKLVLVGFCGSFNQALNVLDDACLARYNADGSPDLTFGGSGHTILDLGGVRDFVTAAALQPDGKIVIGGGCGADFNTQRFCVARVTATGGLDGTFPVAMTLMGSNLSYVNDLAVTSSGAVLAVGSCSIQPWGPVYCIARYTSAGALDTTWAGTGTSATLIAIGGSGAAAVSLQQDGKAVVVGACATNPTFDICVARYNTDGTLDATFGSGGTVITAPSTGSDQATDVTIAPNGKVIVDGTCGGGWCILRYGGDPVTDVSAPDISITIDAADTVAGTGWYNAATSGTNGVLVHVSAQDDTAVTHLTCTDGATTVLDTTTSSGSFVLADGLHSISCEASDGLNPTGAGSGSTPMPVTASVDEVAPTVSCASTTTLLLNEVRSQVNLATVSDSGSGTPIPNWYVSDPNTSTPGIRNVGLSPEDVAGNIRSASCAAYRVNYVFTGFAAPISSASYGFVNAVIGKMIPFRFTLTDVNGNPVTSGVAAPTFADIAGTCTGTSRTFTSADYSKAKAGFTSLGGGNYELRWKGPRGDRGTCRLITITLADGVTHTASIQFAR